MCYSAQIEASFKRYVRLHGADIDIHEYVKIANRIQRAGLEAGSVKVPLAVARSFDDGDSPGEREVAAAFQQGIAGLVLAETQELTNLQIRLEVAQAKLASSKPTKKAADDERIATNKIKQARRRLEDLQRAELRPSDSRMWPGHFVPVLINQDGKRLVTPMRYRCRPFFVDADFDKDRPGTYNARLDNLESFWRPLFGRYHGIVLVSSFFESVDREGKAAEIEFTPSDGEPMIVPCLWSPWGDGDDRLQSFAIITDEPTPEIQAAGHDRRPIQIRPEDVDAWLNPNPKDLESLVAILLRGPRPFYAHELA